MGSEMIGLSSSYKFIWKIENFSKINSENGFSSDVFSLGNSRWKIHINPKGEMLSLFLLSAAADELTKPAEVDFSMTVTSQTDRNITASCESKIRSPKETKEGWGWQDFMPLSELNDPAKGFIVNDTCFITVELSYRCKEAANWQLRRCNGGEGRKSSDV
ncbi:hypothetical protein MKX03_003567 [Papaver bracteatum]|nr:hypothetical protein MKX03_003567 [Papaver bracteatum]